MNTSDDSQDAQWHTICNLAQSKIPRVWSSTFFEKRHISIIDQQSRCLNLCWALSQSGRIRQDSEVAIVGAGISGMTCAVALAIWANCVVYVIEQDTMLLRRFTRSSHRYIHPLLNHTGATNPVLNHDPHYRTDFPFLNWSGAYAPEFAEKFAQKFNHYREYTPIGLYLNRTVLDMSADSDAVNLVSKVNYSFMEEEEKKFNAVILSTGFGEERFGEYTSDNSYWQSGNPKSYEPSPLLGNRSESILVSGNGDSGVIELAHFLIKGFSHDKIFEFLPHNDMAGGTFASHFASDVRRMAHREIAEGYPEFNRKTGPLNWYLQQRELPLEERDLIFNVRTSSGRLFKSFYEFSEGLCTEIDNNTQISLKERTSIELRMRRKLRELASIEIHDWISNIDPTTYYVDEVKRLFRSDVNVTIVGHTPTIYLPDQAPSNWFLLRVLMKYGNVTYKQGSMIDAKQDGESVRCKIDRNGKIETHCFDRVVTRHGPKFSGFSSELSLDSLAGNTPSTPALKEMPLPVEYFMWRQKDNNMRNARLKKLLSRTVNFYDHGRTDIPEEKIGDKIIWEAEEALWKCSDPSDISEAISLFRQFKDKPPEDRASDRQRLNDHANDVLARKRNSQYNM